MLQLQYIDTALVRRREIDAMYRELLAGVNGIQCLSDSGETSANYSYFPILVEPEYPLERDQLYEVLRQNNIFARRYFYPLISEFSMYRGLPSAQRENLPVASSAARKVLCLPIYPALSNDQVFAIADVIISAAI
jgi:dTDP-4-amino-4,6-dideoxygalactose transaminase